MVSNEMIEFPSNGHSARGYLALPGGGGPGVLVIQEWWGLNPQLKGVADRLAAEGFVALAPDLYHGELAGHDEMDKAGQLMNSLPPERAARDMSGAITALLERPETTGDAVGVVGFCMGGMLALMISALEGDRVGARWADAHRPQRGFRALLPHPLRRDCVGRIPLSRHPGLSRDLASGYC